jgi:acetoin utilization deacetylase AcuC-like enzyme
MKIYFSEHHRLNAPNGVMIYGQPFASEDVPERTENILSAWIENRPEAVLAPQDHGLEPILKAHDADFVSYLQNAYAEQRLHHGSEKPVFPDTFAIRPIRHKPNSVGGLKGFYCFSTDTPILAETWKAVYWSAQCALSAADSILGGEQSAYAVCRPPGHHAGRDFYGGFCYLNNAAIAALALGNKVAILDIDFHHGNGTQEIFYQNPEVLFCSLHVDPDHEYPYYWGGVQEHGEGKGEGFNFNWPLPKGIDDLAYLHTLEEALQVIRGFHPRYLVVSAGLDIAAGDPLGGFRITPDGVREIGQRIARLGLPTLIVQEGGYLLDRLGENALALLSAFPY